MKKSWNVKWIFGPGLEVWPVDCVPLRIKCQFIICMNPSMSFRNGWMIVKRQRKEEPLVVVVVVLVVRHGQVGELQVAVQFHNTTVMMMMMMMTMIWCQHRRD
mmetsp:Transcript_121532/g.340345  ORF Transcript_121532/g.340345 Transcript_121532/m.340345 type:complete len:103 (-) Transcript_121532:52-360(-)